jgi:hypothetical protein
MDSEMFSDLSELRKFSDVPFALVKPPEPKRETVWYKDVADSLGKIFEKVNEVDVNVGKRLDALVASISESKPATEKNPDVTHGGDSQGIFATEVNQLLSDVQGLKNELTEGNPSIQVNVEDVVVQQGKLS